MKILIIGNGFLGSAISQRLQSDGHEVLIFARTWRAEIHTQQVLGDIFNFQEFVKVLDWKPQVIVHTAWITTPGVYRDDPSNTEYAKFTKTLAKFVVNSHSDVEHLIVLCIFLGIPSVTPRSPPYNKNCPSFVFHASNSLAAV